MIDAAAIDSGKAKAELPVLRAVFGELEERMVALSDSIEKNGRGVIEDAQSGVQQTHAFVVASLIVGPELIVVAALALACNITRPTAHAVEVAGQLAHGFLTFIIHPHGNDETLQLLQSMLRMQTDFARIVSEVKANAQTMATASREIDVRNLDFFNRTEQQASALQQTAATMELDGSNQCRQRATGHSAGFGRFQRRVEGRRSDEPVGCGHRHQ